MVKRVKVVIGSGRGVAERWRTQYQTMPSGEWSNTVMGSAKTIYDKLCALGPNPDIEAVSDIIGNQGWSFIFCSGCGDYVRKAVSFGSDYSDTDLILCAACLQDGLSAVKE